MNAGMEQKVYMYKAGAKKVKKVKRSPNPSSITFLNNIKK